MNWARSFLIACPLLAAPVAGHALSQVSGPVQIGPSHGDGDTQNHSATLTTTITNQGQLPDRLVDVACPGTGAATLVNGQVREVGTVQQNGIDLPGTIGGRATPVQAQLALSNAQLPMMPGALVPCSLYFQHAGQRIVVFMLGANEAPANEP